MNVGQPIVVDSPAFAGITVFVPLQPDPPKEWLDQVAASPGGLPGKGFTVVDGGIRFHLDRSTSDVPAAMAKIVKAMQSVALKPEDVEADAERRRQQAQANRDKVDRQLETWYRNSEFAASSEAGPAGELPAGGGES